MTKRLVTLFAVVALFGAMLSGPASAQTPPDSQALCKTPPCTPDTFSADEFGQGSGDRLGQGSGDRLGQGSGDRLGQGSGDRLGQGSGDRLGQGSGDRLGQASGDRLGQGGGHFPLGVRHPGY